MIARTLACIALGAAAGLLAAAWQGRQGRGPVEVAPAAVVEAAPAGPSCCAQPGASRASRLNAEK